MNTPINKIINYLLLAGFMFASSNVVALDNKINLAARDNSVLNRVTEPVLIEAYRRIGLDIEFSRLPGNRSIVTANNGQADGEVGRLKFVLGKYKNLLLVPEPIFISRLSAFTRNPLLQIDGWDSLKNHRVAAPASFKLVVNKLKDCPQLVLTSDAASALSLLNDDQVDFAVLNRYEGLQLLSVFGYRDITPVEPPLSKQPIYHLLHKKNEHLIKPLSHALDEMKDDGTLEKIWAEHGFIK